MYDMIFYPDGSFEHQGTICGDGSGSALGRCWEKFNFVLPGNFEDWKELGLSDFEQAPLDLMHIDNNEYANQHIPKFVQIGVEIYPMHTELIEVDRRMFTCPFGREIDCLDDDLEK